MDKLIIVNPLDRAKVAVVQPNIRGKIMVLKGKKFHKYSKGRREEKKP